MKLCCLVLLCLLACVALRADASPFVNLDFEQGSVPPGTTNTIPSEIAFPGWTPRYNDFIPSFVFYNTEGAGGAEVMLADIGGFGSAIPAPEGTFAAVLGSEAGGQTVASLAQFGDVPTNASSIRLRSGLFCGKPKVTLNGTEVQLLPLTPLPGIDFPYEYGADISAFAGTNNVELRFGSYISSTGRFCGFDSIVFSSAPIPEFGATGAGLLLLSLLRLSRTR